MTELELTRCSLPLGYESMDHALYICRTCEEHLQRIRGIIAWRDAEGMVERTEDVDD